MVHTSNNGTATSEIKFLIPPDVAQGIREWARTHLAPDPHGAGADADEYDTCTLYFDTAEFDTLCRRGSYGRAKYRVRRYGDADAIFLERKLRKPGILIKHRMACGIDCLDRLNGSEGIRGWTGEWFQRRLLVRRLHPVCQVSYRRMARNLERGDGPARLTLDSGLRVVAADEARFSNGAAAPFLESHAILELKYSGRFPALWRQLVEDFALSPHNASKYRLGMTWLGHGDAHAPAPPLTRSGVMHA